MSQRSYSHYRNFSREGFQPLRHQTSREMASNPNDVTIDIPLTKVGTSGSRTGARKPDGFTPAPAPQSSDTPEPMDEKQSHHFLRGGPAGRRRRRDQQVEGNNDKDEGGLNAVGRLYRKIYNFSVVTRYFIYVAPLAAAIAVPIVVGATVAEGARIGGVKIVWFFSWIEVVWISLWASKVLARFLPYLFQYFTGVVSTGTRKYALLLRALEIPLSLVGWSICSLTTFVPIMTLNPDQRARGETSLKDWESVVKNILFACVFSTLLLLCEKLFIQLLSISYHRKQFYDRIKESKRHVYLVTLLYDASRQLFPMYCREFAEEDYLINNVLDLAALTSKRNSLFNGHKRSGSATPMRLIQNVARIGDKVTSAFGNVAQEITGKQVFNPTASHSVVVQALEKKHSAEALARRLWMSFVLEGREALYLEDIIDVLGESHEEEAHEAFEILDVDCNGDISLEEMILRITEFGRERKAIANSMHDVDQAIHVLDNLLCSVVFIATIFIFVAWLNKNFTTTLATAGTALLSLSFVFSVTAQEVLGSCIFLFVKHPFDVGDRVDVGDNQYIVERMSLLYTVFRRVADQKRTQVPNNVLNTQWIDNVSRSKAMRERIKLYVSFDTTFEDLDLLKKEMTNFVRDKDNARDYQPDLDIEVTGLAEMDKMELTLEIRHKSNWANEAVRAARRSKFMCALVLALRKIPIYGPGGGAPAAGDPANPTYSVAISDEEAKKNKAAFEEEKDKSRLVPLLPHHKADTQAQNVQSPSTEAQGSSSGAETKEAAAVDHLIRRNVAVDPEETHDREREVAMSKQRSNELEEVRNILRRESTTGRRRAAGHTGLSLTDSAVTRMGSRTIPTVPDSSPPEQVDGSAPSRVDYFEDSTIRPTGSQQMQQQQGWPSVAPLNYYQASTSGPGPEEQEEDAGSSRSRYVPGNAFSQQAYASQQQHQQQQVPRVPVPGMPEMKRTLQNNGGQSPPPPTR
ncbi:Mechanosensitive ion channel protein BA [Exophiala dermatitidis]